jgi:hypothetical protein
MSVVRIQRAFCVEIDFGDRGAGGATDGLSLHVDGDPSDITPAEAREIANTLLLAADEWERSRNAEAAVRAR